MVDVPMNMTDYEETRRTFRLDVPERFNYARDVVDAWAGRDPGKVALVAVGPDGGDVQRLTFGDLAARSDRAAHALAAQGVERGDRVFVMLPRVPAWYDVLLGAFKLGAVPMPGTVQLTAKDIAYRIGRAGATAAVTDVDGAARADAGLAGGEDTAVRGRIVVGGDVDGWVRLDAAMGAAPREPPLVADTASWDPLLVYFTSGTTGHPKMVLHTHASYGIGHEVTARFWQDLKPDDLHWTVSDTGWAKAAWGKLFGQWRIGAAVFLWDAQGKPDLDLMLRMIGEHGVTTFCAPPTVYRGFVQCDLSRYDFSRLRHCMAAGEPLNPDTFEAWKAATGTEIHDGYGQTETVNLIANYRCLPRKPGSMGKPTPGFDVAVIDDEGNVLPPGEEGHIAVRVAPERPVGLFAEYWQDPDASVACMRGDWYDTGDRALVDEDGYFWFVSRDDDVIISAGYRIGPFEVESAVLEHPAVAEVAVIGVPDRDRGQVVKAFVILAPGYEASDDLRTEIQDFVKSTTAPYKYPRQLDFVEELPKTISGKIRRVELRERERAARG